MDISEQSILRAIAALEVERSRVVGVNNKVRSSRGRSKEVDTFLDGLKRDLEVIDEAIRELSAHG